MEIGHKLKDIKLIVDDKTVLTEKDLLGKKVIIYFYPKDDTPGVQQKPLISQVSKINLINLMLM